MSERGSGEAVWSLRPLTKAKSLGERTTTLHRPSAFFNSSTFCASGLLGLSLSQISFVRGQLNSFAASFAVASW